MITVTVMAPDKYWDFHPIVFVFDSEDEATHFEGHVKTYYKLSTYFVSQGGIDTYDSAIESLVEAIGPSHE